MKPKPKRPNPWILTRKEQAILACFVLAGLAAIAVLWFRAGMPMK